MIAELFELSVQVIVILFMTLYTLLYLPDSLPSPYWNTHNLMIQTK